MQSIDWMSLVWFTATSNTISVLLVEEAGVPRDNHRPAASH